MSSSPSITLHMVPPSHPSRAAEAAIRLKGLDYEKVDVGPGIHTETMEEIYGEGNGTVPGMLVDGEPVHGSRAIMAKLEEIAPEPPLFPAEIAEAVREAELWGDVELQPLGRDLAWGALHFRPEAMGTMANAGMLDPAGTDFAIKFLRAAWRYHQLTAVRIAEGLAGLPAKLDHIDELIGEGVIGGDAPNAADLQIASTLRVLALIGDLDELLADRPAGEIGHRLFPDYPGRIPAGAFPAGWVPSRA
jgi:glutathione S-transferase